MEPGTRTNIKRAVMVLVPGITAPVIDFAINNVYLASISSQSMRQPALRPPRQPLEPPPLFTLKKMDSGDWGELSLANPLKQKYKSPLFNDPSKLEFKLDD